MLRPIGLIASCVLLCAASPITVYMTETSCDDAHFAATSAPIKAAGFPIICRPGNVLPTPDLQVTLVNHSNSAGDNAEYTAMDRDWDDYSYRTGVAIINSAGNTAKWVRAPAKGLNVITVGDGKENSSWINSEIMNEKPEVAWLADFTSFAAAPTTAFAAKLLSEWTWYQRRPHLLKAALIAGSRSTGNVDRDGAGIIDPKATFYNGKGWYWESSNSAWADRTVTYPMVAGRHYQVAVAWLTRGTYTFDHKTIGNVYGLYIDGVPTAISLVNPYQLSNFKAPSTGTYTIRVKRLINSDTACNARVALRVQYLP